MQTVLLGPQRFRMTAGVVAFQIAPEGPVATITAGWRDRERDDDELNRVMGERTTNLQLFTRLGHVVRHDRAFAAAASTYNRAADEASSLYLVRLGHAMDAVYATLRRSVRDDLVESSLVAGLQSLRDIDDWYLWLLSELEGELRATSGLDHSDVVLQHRGEINEVLSGAALLAIAGGNVSFLMRCLRLFDVMPAPHMPVIGWSAGAMVLTDRVVLYNDNGPQGVAPSEIWERGLGRVHGIVAMPHARRRLLLDNLDRNRVLARRYGPARVVLLDDGSRVEIGADGLLPEDARVIGIDGQIRTIGEENAADAAAAEAAALADAQAASAAAGEALKHGQSTEHHGGAHDGTATQAHPRGHAQHGGGV